MRYFGILIISLMFFSCGVKKGVRYFENIEEIEGVFNETQNNFVYQPNDLLNIRITSKDNVAVAPFNITESSFIGQDGVGESNVSIRPYLVKPDGTIEMPTIGTVEVAGKSREELKRDIKSILVPEYLKDPMIDIELINFKISVIGDVGKPGVFTIENERVTIVDAIALAGDMNSTGIRENVLVMREENGQKRFIRVNFLSNSIFESPAYYLKQNDVIYVEQNAVKTREASWDSKIPFYTSFIALALTIYAVLSR